METYGAAGFFGVAVDYKGIDDAHGAAICPVVVKPRHAVVEQPKAGDSTLLECLPVALTSAEWFGGKIEHLPMALISPKREFDKWTSSPPCSFLWC